MATTDELNLARAAYYKLITGQTGEEFIDQNGEKVRFTKGNAAALLAWINSNDPTQLAARAYQPMKFLF